jgi:hypothetical protein
MPFITVDDGIAQLDFSVHPPSPLLRDLGLAGLGTLFVIPTADEAPIGEALLARTRRAFPAKILLYAAIAVALVGIVTGIFTE